MKEFVKKILKRSSIGRAVYEPLHQVYRLYSVPHRRMLLRKYGVEVMAELARQFKKHDIPAYATYGTLLGFVRDRGFIPHDDDIDVAIMPSERWNSYSVLRVLLSEPGFSYLFGFNYDNKLVEYKLMFKHIPIDFYFPEMTADGYGVHEFFYTSEIAYPSDRHNSVKILCEPRVLGLKSIHIMGVDFPIPTNAEEMLEGMYGKTWRIPNAKWDGAHVPNVLVLPHFGVAITKEMALAHS